MTTIYETLDTAIEYHQSGNLGQAEQLYRQILQVVPNHSDTLHLLGILASQVGRNEVAIDLISRAIELQPEKAVYHYNLALAMECEDRFDKALLSLKRALQLDPNYAQARLNLATVQRKVGQIHECIPNFQRAIELQPHDAEAHFLLGLAYEDLRQRDLAMNAFQEAIRQNPNYLEAYNNVGNIHKAHGRYALAVDAYQQAIHLDPDQPDLYLNLGNIYFLEGRLESAVAAYEKAIALRPNSPEVHRVMGDALQELGRHDRAIASYQNGLQYEPNNMRLIVSQIHQMQHMCQWRGLDDLTGRLIRFVEQHGFEAIPTRIPPLGWISLPVPTTAAQQLRCAQAWSKIRCEELGLMQPSIRKNRPSPRAKIRIGYLSGDLRIHPVGLLIGDLLESHDRNRFEVYGYSMGVDDKSPLRARLVKSFDLFRDFRTTPFREAAEQIERDEIDILVDLQGYTQNCRTEILAFRPAPIQVNYLGYAGTMGADFIDYVVVDSFVVPEEEQSNFSEKRLPLDGCFMVNDRHRELSTRSPSRMESQLPENGIVFCAFSAPYKIKQAMFECWMRILDQVPRSVLWLRDSNEHVTANLRREAQRQGISSHRLIFAPKVSMSEHMARHRAADLFLDTFPYNQHSSASDALRMGLPLLTLCGDTFASRIAGSLLNSLGLNELITNSLQAYESLAVELALQPDRLRAIRQKLEVSLESSTLFDGRAFAKKFEEALLRIYHFQIR